MVLEIHQLQIKFGRKPLSPDDSVDIIVEWIEVVIWKRIFLGKEQQFHSNKRCGRTLWLLWLPEDAVFEDFAPLFARVYQAPLEVLEVSIGQEAILVYRGRICKTLQVIHNQITCILDLLREEAPLLLIVKYLKI